MHRSVSTVFRADIPMDVKAVYTKEPNTPAPPVPDDQVEITFLTEIFQVVNQIETTILILDNN